MAFFTNIFQDIETKIKENLNFDELTSVLTTNQSHVNPTVLSPPLKNEQEIKDKKIPVGHQPEDLDKALGVICKDCGRRTGKFIDRHSCHLSKRKTTLLQRFSSVPVMCKDCFELISGLPHMHKCGIKVSGNSGEIGIKCKRCWVMVFGDPSLHRCSEFSGTRDSVIRGRSTQTTDSLTPTPPKEITTAIWDMVVDQAETFKDLLDSENFEKLTIRQVVKNHFNNLNQPEPKWLDLDAKHLPIQYTFKSLRIPGTEKRLAEYYDSAFSDQRINMNNSDIKRVTFMGDANLSNGGRPQSKMFQVIQADDQAKLQRRRSRAASGMSSIRLSKNREEVINQSYSSLKDYTKPLRPSKLSSNK